MAWEPKNREEARFARADIGIGRRRKGSLQDGVPVVLNGDAFTGDLRHPQKRGDNKDFGVSVSLAR